MGKSKSKSSKKKGTKKVALKSNNKKTLKPQVEKKKRKRKVSDYLVLQTAISKYCADRYSRLMSDPSISADDKKKIRKRCSKQEVSEIYQGLKSRFLKSKTKGMQISASDLSIQIEQKLAYKGKESVPFTCREFEWYLLIDTLYGADGFFFKPSDVLNFNCNMGGAFNMGVFSSEYNSLEDTYKEEMYSVLREYMDDIQEENDSSVKPFFVFNEELSDIENRIFWWDLNDGLESAGSGRDGDGGGKGETKEMGEDFELTEDDIRDEVESGKKGAKKKDKEVLSESVLLEREKTKQEREKSKQMAMELLKDGLITKEEFLKLAGI